MKKNAYSLSRRRWLRAAGTAGLAAGIAPSLSPFVPSMVRAQDDVPKRVLVVYHGLGYLENSFWPTPGPSGRADDFTLGESMRVLEPHREQLIYPDGLLLYGAQYFYPDDDNEHASGGNMTFTGSWKDDGDGDNGTRAFASGPSFEQAIADHIWSPTDPVTPYRDMALAINGAYGPHHAAFFRGDQQPVVGQGSPAAAFETFFGALGDVGDPAAEEAARRRLAQRQSILDHVRGELEGTRRRIGRQERDAMDAHLAGLRALEARVNTIPTGQCSVPDAPVDTPRDLVQTFESQVDLITSAFTCDLTRVATLQLGHCDGGLTLVEGLNAHGVTHAIGETREDPEAFQRTRQEHLQLDRFWADRWRYLLDALSNVTESNGSLLDNTLVVWGTDTTTREQYNPGPHQHMRMPYFMAGGSNWAFPTGRHLRYDQPVSSERGNVDRDTGARWHSNSRLWTSVLQRYGLDVDRFGTADIGSGTLPEL